MAEEEKKELPKNIKDLGNGFYLVRSQAGFRKLIKQSGLWDLAKSKRANHDYPKEYPSVVTLSVGYFGYDYLIVKCIPLNVLKESIKDS